MLKKTFSKLIFQLCKQQVPSLSFPKNGPVLPDERNAHRTTSTTPLTGIITPSSSTNNSLVHPSIMVNDTIVSLNHTSNKTAGDGSSAIHEPKPKNETETDFKFESVSTTTATTIKPSDSLFPKSPLDPSNKLDQNRPEGETDRKREENNHQRGGPGDGTNIENGGDPFEGEETGETDYPDFSNNRNPSPWNRNHQATDAENSSNLREDSLRKLLSLLRSGQLSDNQRREIMQRLLQAQGPDYGGD